jgi:hypothetical protein
MELAATREALMLMINRAAERSPGDPVLRDVARILSHDRTHGPSGISTSLSSASTPCPAQTKGGSNEQGPRSRTRAPRSVGHAAEHASPSLLVAYMAANGATIEKAVNSVVPSHGGRSPAVRVGLLCYLIVNGAAKSDAKKIGNG